MPTPAIQTMCQNPATTPTKVDIWATTRAVSTTIEPVTRPRKTS
jgi:hypothetical protein